MKTFLKCTICVGALLLPLQAWCIPIRDVSIQLQGANGSLPPVLAKRMKASLQTVGEHVLVGRDSDTVTMQLKQYETVTTDIAGRVLYGYDIQDLHVTPGQTSTIDILVKPYGKVVKNIDIVYDYGNLSPMAKALIQKKVPPMESQIKQILMGASLDAFDWIRPVTETILRERINAILPDFVAKVSVEEGENTKVYIYIIPQGDIVRRALVNFNSTSLPRAVFLPMRQEYTAYMSEIEGLPVNFVRQHAPEIEAMLSKKLANSRATQTFHIHFTPHIVADRTTDIIINAVSNKYVVRGETRVDMGKKENNFSFKAHVGYKITDKEEFFVDTEFYPGDYAWDFYPSVAYHFNSGSMLAYQYDINDKDHIFWWQQELGPKLRIRAQRRVSSHTYQYALAYDLQQYMTLEYIVEKDNDWLRVIGHI